jgi:hypothetical protein
VEYLPSKHKALSSNSSTREGGREGEREREKEREREREYIILVCHTTKEINLCCFDFMELGLNPGLCTCQARALAVSQPPGLSAGFERS